MEHIAATHCFATLGHSGRLAVFRLLMRFVPHGVRPTEMADALGMKQNTLSHHLADLISVGLVTVERQGRSLFYAVDLAATEALIGHLALDIGRARPDLLRFGATADHPAPTDNAPYTVLFICSGNSARSILAEALLRDLGQSRFQAFSAGTNPGGVVNTMAAEILQRNGHGLSGLQPKSIDAFRGADAVRMDFVFTVCDTAAGEECPPWHGQPITAHWGLPDPVKATGSDAEKELAFARTYAALRRRIAAFVELPFAALDRLALQTHVDALGTDPETETKG